jgi:conjugative transfer signal peptidase TraF
MVERRDVSDIEAAPQLRRRIARRLALAGLIGCAAVPLAATLFWNPPILLVWNASSSAPIGLYRVEADAPVRRGDMVIAWIAEPARSLAASRRYLPANVPLVKRAAAVPGDVVCAAGSEMSINGMKSATRRKSDAAQRPMPWWTGCRRLGQGEYFLLMDRPDSFDGRYFGVTQREQLVGRAVLVWARPSKMFSHG